MIVDVHSHLFNGDDLPVAGFLSHYDVLRDIVGAAALADFLDRFVQGRAPDYATDRARLQALLSGQETVLEDPLSALAADVLDARAMLDSDPELLAEVKSSLVQLDIETGLSGEDPLAAADIDRAVRWVALFAQSRVDLPGQYVASSGAEVTLGIPMMVDLDAGVEDQSKTSQAEQVELFDLVSQASMRGLLPGAEALALHPFVAFDPLRQLRHTGDGDSPLDVVKRAVLASGFIGVKVYPPMGWRPSGNAGRADLPISEGRALDEVVAELARWCVEADVPITAHGNDSNYADDRFHDFGAPVRWQGLLSMFPGLRLNMGHFGGIHPRPTDYNWTQEIAEMMRSYDFLYADVSCQRIEDPDLLAAHLAVYQNLHQAGCPIADRVILGTDWYLQAINPQSEQFVPTYRTAWANSFGKTAADQFVAGNALHFLGFDSSTNQNAQRLGARYDALGVTRPAWLAPRT